MRKRDLGGNFVSPQVKLDLNPLRYPFRLQRGDLLIWRKNKGGFKMTISEKAKEKLENDDDITLDVADLIGNDKYINCRKCIIIDKNL